jgi:hypothetical protein
LRSTNQSKRLRQECPILDSSWLKFSLPIGISRHVRYSYLAQNAWQSPESKIRRKLNMANDNRSTAADLFAALLRYRSSKTIGDQSHSIEDNSLKVNIERDRATPNPVSSNNGSFNRDSLSRMSVTGADPS